MLNWSRKLFDRQYVALLEDEVQRLRGENRALMNSLLGTAGFPPVEFPAAPLPRELPRTRRRSWHQIQAWREAAAARNGSDDLTKRQVPGS
jgi:predicted cobalt transporter CbtA